MRIPSSNIKEQKLQPRTDGKSRAKSRASNRGKKKRAKNGASNRASTKEKEQNRESESDRDRVRECGREGAKETEQEKGSGEKCARAERVRRTKANSTKKSNLFVEQNSLNVDNQIY